MEPGKYLGLSETFLEMIERRMAPPPSVTLPDWKNFNRVTGGFRMNEFSIVCGPTGCGKTTFLANLSAQLAKTEARQFIMSVETGAHDYMARVASAVSGMDLNSGDRVPESIVMRLAANHQETFARKNMFFSLYEDRVSVEQIMHDIEHLQQKERVNIVFIDNLNYLLDVRKSTDLVVEMDRVIHSLIVFVKRLPVHIVMVMHPRKTEGGRVESEFDIKGSATAVQEAQNVFLFNRPNQKEIESGERSKFERELKIAKMRRRGQFVGNFILFKNEGTRYLESEQLYEQSRRSAPDHGSRRADWN
jgi:twinkle protein